MVRGWVLILLGIAVHLVYMMSIFDVYFRSPLVHGMTPHFPTLKSPAKRLVLFSADGLRYDRFFELTKTGESRIPFLRRVIREKGSWGVNHVRLPTESRPCHVALISGFYEDVSAIKTGWQENPVEFDNLFNQSRHSWCWGCPDVLKIFLPRGRLRNNVAMGMLPPHLSGGDNSVMDLWVFDRVKELFRNSMKNQDSWNMLQQDKIVFFLHLNGLDTNGHLFKPYSRQYLANIAIIDEGVKNLVSLFENYYNDSLTTYIFTSDHGMNDGGDHSLGKLEDTLVPLVAWGAGIRGPQPAEQNRYYEPKFPDEWNLNKFHRMDIFEADAAALMSSLIGIPVPVNNIGILPTQYLDASPEFKADAILANLRQLLAMFEVKRANAKAHVLSQYATPSSSTLMKRVGKIKDAIKEGQYEKAIELSDTLIKQLSAGIQFYETFDRLFIGSIIAIGYLGWMMCLLVEALPWRSDTSVGIVKAGLLNKAAFAIGLSTSVLLYLASSPVTYYFYCLLPVLFWHHVAKCGHVLLSSLQQITKDSLIELGSTLLGSIIVTEALVFSFFDRKTLSLGCCVAAVWPLMSKSIQASRKVRIGWVASCLSVAYCATLPLPRPVYHWNYLIILSSFTAIALTIYCMTREELATLRRHNFTLFIFQIIWLVIATAVAMQPSAGLIHQTLSYIILISSLFIPFLTTKNVLTRLLSIALALLPAYILFTTEYESLFYTAFCCLMFFWLRIEQKSGVRLEALQFGKNQPPSPEEGHHKEQPLRVPDLQTAVMFVFFLFAAFFCSGNFISDKTLDLSSLRCFNTFSSSTITLGLLVWKIVIPLVLVSATFSAIHVAGTVPLKTLLLVVSLVSEGMALQFFYMITTYGSWFEIGLSIGRYVATMLVMAVFLILVGLAQILTGSFRLTLRSRSLVEI